MHQTIVTVAAPDPPPSENAAARLRALLRRWFVLYNPLYFASASMVLAGLLLLGRSLPSTGLRWEHSQLAVAGVSQLYEGLLIVVAAVLVHRGLIRPAVMLALVAMVFFFDGTFQTETLGHVEPWDTAASAAWFGLALLKLAAWRVVFRLRFSTSARVLVVGAVTILAWGAWWLDSGFVDAQPWHLATTWLVAALGVYGRLRSPDIRTELELDSWGRLVLARSSRFFGYLAIAAVLVRLVIWMPMYGLRFDIGYATPILWSILMLSPRVKPLFAALCFLAPSIVWSTLTPILLVAAPVVGAVLWRQRDLRHPELTTALIAWLGLVLWRPIEPYLAAWAYLMILSVAFSWWTWRSLRKSSAAAALLCLGAGLTQLDLGPVGWGIALLVAGFLALGGGLLVTLRLGGDPEQPAAGDS